AKAFLDQGSLPSHRQRKHAKRESLLDDEDLKLVACTWLHSTLPKDQFPLALKKELESSIFSKLLGVSQKIYSPRDDIKEYCKEWVLRMMNCQKKIEQYSSNEMKITILLERHEIYDTRHVLVTHDKAYFYTNDDNSSFWLKDNESIIKKKGQGSSIM
ncbi:35972_t:CDS:2, partial [Gigaspora margarita]